MYIDVHTSIYIYTVHLLYAIYMYIYVYVYIAMPHVIEIGALDGGTLLYIHLTAGPYCIYT